MNARICLAVGALTGATGLCGTAIATPHHRMAPPRPCRTVQLRASLGGGAGAGMSQIHTGLQLRNISRTACTLYGYPSVFWVSRHGGHHVGRAAVRSTVPRPSRVTVLSGRIASASLDIVEGDGGLSTRQCRPQPVAGLRIDPAGQRASLFLPLRYEGVGVCTIGRLSTLSVGAVRDGAIAGNGGAG